MNIKEGILARDDLTDKEFRLLCTMILNADNQGLLCVSASKLASFIRSDQRYVFRLMSSLTAKGYVETLTAGNGRKPAKRKLATKAYR